MEVDIETVSQGVHEGGVPLSIEDSEPVEEEEGRSIIGEIGEPSTSGDYTWVHTEMRDLQSCYSQGFLLEGFISSYKLSEMIHLPKIRIFPSHSHCRIYHTNNDDGAPPSFYVYDTMFKRLRLTLPFTFSQRSILNKLNVAPTQLHLVTWAFVRAFEILTEVLGFVPTVEVFFCFFKAKGVDKGKIVSLNSTPKF